MLFTSLRFGLAAVNEDLQPVSAIQLHQQAK